MSPGEIIAEYISDIGEELVTVAITFNEKINSTKDEDDDIDDLDNKEENS